MTRLEVSTVEKKSAKMEYSENKLNKKIKKSERSDFGTISKADSSAGYDWISCIAILIRDCSEFVCLKYSNSPADIINLLIFTVSSLGTVFTFIFVFSHLFRIMQNSKPETGNNRYEVVFCLTWSVLSGFLTSLLIIYYDPVGIRVICGYLSMICYAFQGYRKGMRGKHSESEIHDPVHENYCQVQSDELKSKNDWSITVQFSDANTQ